jgi:hypothetical protein
MKRHHACQVSACLFGGRCGRGQHKMNVSVEAKDSNLIVEVSAKPWQIPRSSWQSQGYAISMRELSLIS